MKFKVIAACIGLVVASPAQGQVRPAPVSPAPAEAPLPPSGVINGAWVTDVVIVTRSPTGPYTAFLIRTSWTGSDHWFVVSSGDNAVAAERGAIIGLLMGAAETVRWHQSRAPVNISYITVNDQREIISASLFARLGD